MTLPKLGEEVNLCLSAAKVFEKIISVSEKRSSANDSGVKLSVVLTTYNEMALGLYPQILERLKAFSEAEVIVVDRQSQDGTPHLAQKMGFLVLSSDSNSRASRLNLGIAQATGSVVLLHHPRSLLAPGALEALTELAEQSFSSGRLFWGGFTHQLDWDHPLLRFTSWYSNEIRAKKSKIVYLDHCIFAHRELLGKEPPFLPEVEIFEDTLLSKMLSQKAGPPVILPQLSTTSALRFRKRGVWRQALLNQALKVGFHLNFPNTWMNRIYENRLWLNSDKS